MSGWSQFWDSLDSEQRRLFRMLQRVHRELGSNVQMFSTSHIGPKADIHQYVLEKFNVDLNDLPKSSPGDRG